MATAPSSLDPPARDPRDAQVLRLFAEHGDTVFRLGLLMLGLTQEAEDVVQETFLLLLKHLSSEGPLPNARGWILTVAAHICRDRQRASRRWLPWLAEADTRTSMDRADAGDPVRPLITAVPTRKSITTANSY